MKYTHYISRFSSKAQGVAHINGDWIDIIDIVTDKTKWRTFSAKDKDTYNEAKKKFDAIVMAEMKPNMPRTADNVVSFYAIVLDIDDGATYQEVRDDLKNYEYVLYSSGGTGLKGGDRFRVILPLNVPMPASDWKRYNTSLSERFTYSDECFKKGIQIQYLPVMNKAYEDQFICEHNKGQWFDYQNPNDLPYIEVQSLEAITKNVIFDEAQFTDSEFQELARAIIDHQANSLGYEARRLLAQRLKHIGMNDFDSVMVLDAVSKAGFSIPNSVLVNGANPLYAHVEGLYKHVAKGVRIPALERRIVRSVTSGTVLDAPVRRYDGEWTLEQKQYIRDIAPEMDFSTGITLLIADVGTGKTVYWTDKERKNVKFIAPLTSIVNSIGDVNSLTVGDVGTWNQIEGIINTQDKSVFKGMTLVVDECHGLFVDYGYKSRVINRLIDSFKYFKSVVLMSGTVEADYFSSIKFDRVYRVRKSSQAIKNIRTFFCTKKDDVLIEQINNLTNKTIVLVNNKILCETIKQRINRSSLVVTADNKNDPEVQAFYKSGLMTNFDVLIGTNSIVEGLSIEDKLYDVDIVIWDDIVPERIEQFCNRFRKVSSTKNVWYFVDRKPVETLEEYKRSEVLEDVKTTCIALQNVYNDIKTVSLKRSFTRQFSGEIAKDLMYYHDGQIKVSYTGIDYEYALHREKQYRNDFGMLAHKLQEYGFSVYAPMLVDGDEVIDGEIKESMKAAKVAKKKEREDELQKLIQDIDAGQVQKGGSDIYQSTYNSVQKLLAKGLDKNDISKAITGYIDDDAFFAKAHEDADYVKTGSTIREFIVNEVGEKTYLKSSEIGGLAQGIAEKVLVDYFGGDIERMAESRSWGGLVAVTCSGNAYKSNILRNNNTYPLPLHIKSPKAAKEIVEKFIKLDKGKIKSINGDKVRIAPVLALSRTGLRFHKMDDSGFTHQAIANLKAKADALKPIITPPVEIPEVVAANNLQKAKIKTMIKTNSLF